MKKMLLFLIGIFVAIVLVACADESTDDQDAENTTEESGNTEETNEASGTQDANENEENGEAAPEEFVTLADQFITHIASEEYEEATQLFDDNMKEQLTPEAIDEMWLTVEDQFGEYIDHEYSSSQEVEGYQIILLDGLFENSDALFEVTFDENQQIAGFYIR